MTQGIGAGAFDHGWVGQLSGQLPALDDLIARGHSPHSVVASLPNPRHESRAVGTLLDARAQQGPIVVDDMRRVPDRSA